MKNRWVILIVVAALTVVSSSCGKKKNIKTPPDLVRQHEQIINNMSRLALQGRYGEAMGDCTDFLQRYSQSPVMDHALFVCGIVWAAGDNPQKDYKQSLGYFDRLTRETPGSNYAPSARLVSQLVTTVLDLQSTDTKKAETIRDLQTIQTQQIKTIRDLQREIEKIKRIDLNKRP